MESKVREAIQALIAEGQGDRRGEKYEKCFLPLVTLESGASIGIDAQSRWILLAEGGASTVIDEGTAHLLHEALEWKRSRFEESIAEAARSFGLPEEEIVFAFPAIALVRAVLEKRSSYLTRLALHWLLPSEVRELRQEILEVTRDPAMPGPVKDLAGRLVVPAD